MAICNQYLRPETMGKEVLKIPTKKKSDNNFITIECLLAFDKDEDKMRVLTLMRKFS